MRTAANLTSTLLAHHVAVKLETILDREAKISHEAFAGQIEGRLGYGEGDNAKGPDMRVWQKGKGLNDVRVAYGHTIKANYNTSAGRLVFYGVLLHSRHSIAVNEHWLRPAVNGRVIAR